jgi:hypothetical protein
MDFFQNPYLIVQVVEKSEKKPEEKVESTPTTPVDPPDPTPPTPPETTLKKRCDKCCRKTGMLGLLCKCGLTVCTRHRYPWTHDCQYDGRLEEHKERIRKAHPLLVRDKLQDRI